jgi:hypothetical protein
MQSPAQVQLPRRLPAPQRVQLLQAARVLRLPPQQPMLLQPPWLSVLLPLPLPLPVPLQPLVRLHLPSRARMPMRSLQRMP